MRLALLICPIITSLCLSFLGMKWRETNAEVQFDPVPIILKAFMMLHWQWLVPFGVLSGVAIWYTAGGLTLHQMKILTISVVALGGILVGFAGLASV